MNNKGEANRSVRATRRRLSDALVQLLVQKPVRQITVRELTRLAKVSRGTFYFHYRDIYELLDRLEQDQIDQLNLFMDALLPRLNGESEEMPTALLGDNGDPAFSRRLQEVIAERCIGYLAPGGGTFRQRYLTAFAVEGCFGAIAQWLQRGKQESAAEMADVTWLGIRTIQRQIIAAG